MSRRMNKRMSIIVEDEASLASVKLRVVEAAAPSSSLPSTKKSTFTYKSLDFLLRLNLLKLCRCHHEGVFTGSMLRLDNPFLESKKQEYKISSRRANKLDKLFAALKYMIILFYMIKWILLSHFHLKQHRLQAQIVSLLRERLLFDSSEKCFSNISYYQSTMNQMEQSIELKSVISWLHFLGSPFESLTSASLYTYSMASSIPILYLISAAYLHHISKVELDVIGFIYSPEIERIRMRQILSRLVDNICNSLASLVYHEDDGRNHLRSFASDFLSGHKLDEIYSQAHGRMPILALETPSEQNKSILLNALAKIKELLRRDALQAVKPAILEDTWLKFITKISNIFLMSNLCIGISVGFVLVIIMIFLELIVRVQYRVGQIECKSINSALIESALYSYLNNDLQGGEQLLNGSSTFLGFKHKAIFLIEAKNLLKLRVCISAIELVIWASCCSAWISLYFVFFFLSFLHRVRWMMQIESQLQACCRLFNRIHSKEEEPDERLEVKLKADLVEVYLNYSLFRKLHKNHLTLTNILLDVAGLFCGVNLTICYYLAKNVESSFNIVLFIITFLLILYQNVFFACSAYKTGRIDKLAREVFNLQTTFLTKKLKYCSILNYWQRELLTERDARRIFAANLMGVRLSYKHWLRLNSYLALLIYILVVHG